MLSIRKINPMVRAITTMGAVAALAGGVTFAQLQSNTVILTDNTISVSSAHLQLGVTNGDNCSDAADGTQPGMNFSNLVPGTTSSNFAFCFRNTGTSILDITAMIPTDFSSSPVPASDVTLNLQCGVNGALTDTLNNFGSAGELYGSLAPGATVDCYANVTVSGSDTAYGQSVASFDLDFVGQSS